MPSACDTWEHPDWSGEMVFILGGGPSLRGFDPAILRNHPVIAIHEAGLTMCPWADILFWSDVRWQQWNEQRIALHTGEMRYTCQRGWIEEVDRARYIHFVPRCADGSMNAFDNDPRSLGGYDSGSRCINLAYHTGAAGAVLLGFDMHDLPLPRWQEGNWHDAHKAPPEDGQRAKFREAHDRMAAALPEGFAVYNATPGSALTCWPTLPLEEFL